MILACVNVACLVFALPFVSLVLVSGKFGATCILTVLVIERVIDLWPLSARLSVFLFVDYHFFTLGLVMGMSAFQVVTLFLDYDFVK